MSNVVQFIIKGHDQFSGTLGKLEKQLFSLKGALVGLGVGAIAKSFVDAASTSEKLRVRLKVLTGSVAEGNRMFDLMAKYASEVPFQFEEIMQSSTQLAGVVKGGVDEVAQWMPLVGDLAAATGLGLQDTTTQVIRMLSGGAAAADMFRERGVLAMLGFKSGVSYSVGETRKMLLDAWNDPMSRFKGATVGLATTLDGVLSMMADKWFQFRNLVMDAGLLNYIKAIAIVIDKWMGESLEETKGKAKSWADTIIHWFKRIMHYVGILADGFRGISIIYKILETGWWVVMSAIVDGVGFIIERIEAFTNTVIGMFNTIVQAAPNLAEKLGLKEMQEVDFTSDIYKDILKMAEAAETAKNELHNMLMEKLPSTAIEEKMAEIDAIQKQLNESMRKELELTGVKQQETVKTFLDYMQSSAAAFLEKQGEVNEAYAKSTFDIMMKTTDAVSKAFADSIVDGENMFESLKAIGATLIKEIISMLIKQAAQRLISAAITKMAATTEGVATNAANVSAAASGAYAATAAIPVVGPALAPAAAAQAIAGATAAAISGKAAGAAVGAAHGGLTNVPKEQTYLLDRGERVLSPGQNKDLTDFMGAGGGGGTTIIESIVIEILPNATNADALLKMDPVDVEEIVAGPIIRALNKLDKKGIRQEALEKLRN